LQLNVSYQETNVKNEQNGRESLRRLKPIVGCNAGKRRKEEVCTNNANIYQKIMVMNPFLSRL